MANGSQARGTRKNGRGQFRTPKLSDAQKRANKLNRSTFGMGRGSRYTGGDVPF